jgi:hypothetical protein
MEQEKSCYINIIFIPGCALQGMGGYYETGVSRLVS